MSGDEFWPIDPADPVDARRSQTTAGTARPGAGRGVSGDPTAVRRRPRARRARQGLGTRPGAKGSSGAGEARPHAVVLAAAALDATSAIRSCWARPLSRLLVERGWDVPAAVVGVTERWAEIAGADLADHCRPEKFDTGVLHLVAESTAWATQVRLLVPQLHRRIDEVIGARRRHPDRGSRTDRPRLAPRRPASSRSRPSRHLRLSVPVESPAAPVRRRGPQV